MVVTGFVVLADGCDGEDITINGLSFDCGTGFCTTGLVTESSLSFADISCNNAIIIITHSQHHCHLTRLFKSSPLIVESCEISAFLFIINSCNLPACITA